MYTSRNVWRRERKRARVCDCSERGGEKRFFLSEGPRLVGRAVSSRERWLTVGGRSAYLRPWDSPSSQALRRGKKLGLRLRPQTVRAAHPRTADSGSGVDNDGHEDSRDGLGGPDAAVSSSACRVAVQVAEDLSNTKRLLRNIDSSCRSADHVKHLGTDETRAPQLCIGTPRGIWSVWNVDGHWIQTFYAYAVFESGALQ
ncbi:hypothetical protein HDK90DRAFT_1555 [Phyllosticta capitalensis]|uniref:Uncharacterized protein n=1 Tax=Phyllosticta capitalensis TaxID=121624 RepID=A0ABR1Z1B3_9PEZI